jgi:hypothetical protein
VGGRGAAQQANGTTVYTARMPLATRLTEAVSSYTKQDYIEGIIKGTSSIELKSASTKTTLKFYTTSEQFFGQDTALFLVRS